MKAISSLEIQDAIARGQTKLEDRLVGTVVFKRDIDGKSEIIDRIKLYDLSGIDKRHVIHVGSDIACDLRPELKNGEMHPDAHERHGYIYAENGKVYFVTEKRTILDLGSQIDDTCTDDKSWNDFGKTGKKQRLEWSKPQHCTAYLGICAGPIASKPEFKLFYISKEWDF